jgi:uncharacterized protein
VKKEILAGNNARLYNIDIQKTERDLNNDRLAIMKAEYEKDGQERSNLRYGYIAEPIADYSVFA